MSPLKTLLSITIFLMLMAGCKKKAASERVEVKTAEDLSESVHARIEDFLDDVDEKGMFADSFRLLHPAILKEWYDRGEDALLWPEGKRLGDRAAAFYDFVQHAHRFGLYPEDYQQQTLRKLKAVTDADKGTKTDVVPIALTELLYTDALVSVINDLQQGRLVPDSLKRYNDEKYFKDYFFSYLTQLREGRKLSAILSAASPGDSVYNKILFYVPGFVDSMDLRPYTYVQFPSKDSLSFSRQIKKRLTEAGYPVAENADSTTLADVVKQYQSANGLTTDGKPGRSVISKLNNTDRRKFDFLAVTLDKFKMKDEKLPSRYVWVNMPSFELKLVDPNGILLRSKVVCGKPVTPTPLISSAISDMVLYPTWTVPASIIQKEILPGLKRNPGYLAKKGLYLLDKDGNQVSPYGVDWSKYSKGIPYRVQQGSGDDNALGVIKFNFSNPFDVYLHDTNQRYLFKNASRALSHGCVRVQDWEKLANYIAVTDSIKTKKRDSTFYTTDSLKHWLAMKQRRVIKVKQQLPVFIRYYTVEADREKLQFYEDIYGTDDRLIRKYLKGAL